MTDVEVGAAVATGAGSVKAIRKSTGAGSSCGSCVKRLSCLLSAYKESAPDPEPQVFAQQQAVPQPQAQRAPVGDHLLGCPAAVPAIG